MPGALSTIEAIVTALNILESPAGFDELLRPFDALIEGQIDAMGKEVYRRNHADDSALTRGKH
jgi:DTW domain-containing protein YfiP